MLYEGDDPEPLQYELLNRVVCIRRPIDKKTLRAREKLNRQMESEMWRAYDAGKDFDMSQICRRSSPWADCIEALEHYEQRLNKH